jgi:uncharacterized protein with NRDE domain
MCTLIALHRCVVGAPLVIAANRDEFFERPTEGLALRDTVGGRIVAPRDVRAGGTWLGVNVHGVFAALTNRRSEQPDPARRSRGLLVLDALRARTAAEAAGALEDLVIDAYNPFNLLVADGSTAHVVSYEGKAVRFDLDAGAHVVGNVHPLDRGSEKLERLRRRAEHASDAPEHSLLDALADVCRDHDGDGAFDAACVHSGSYGTRSSTLLRLGGAGGGELRFAAGAPCQNPYLDFTALLRELDSGRVVEGATT